jgi:hypothetical protein
MFNPSLEFQGSIALKIFFFLSTFLYTELGIHHIFGYQSTKWQIIGGKGKQGMTNKQY